MEPCVLDGERLRPHRVDCFFRQTERPADSHHQRVQAVERAGVGPLDLRFLFILAPARPI